MRKLVFSSLIALGAAVAVSPAFAQYAQRTAEPAEIAAPTFNSVLLENNGGLQLASGQKVTVAVDAAGVMSIVTTEQLGWNAVAPGPSGSSSVASTAQPGTVIYSLQGPVLKIESGLATPFNYSAVASIDQNDLVSSQNVKTCTVLPNRAVFECGRRRSRCRAWSLDRRCPTPARRGATDGVRRRRRDPVADRRRRARKEH